jgi:pimeloyl-ACP methyl ester carboxylesterase
MPPASLLAPPSHEVTIDADILRALVLPGASMHVERYGRGGTPIVLLHGFGTSSFLWREVGPQIALARHTAFAIDLLGYGESDRPFDAEFGIAAQTEYLDRAMTSLRLSKAVIVGVDLGGAIAMSLAAKRPERVEKLVLVNSLGLDEVPGKDLGQLQRNTARFALRLNRGVLGAMPLLDGILRASVADQPKMPPKLVGRYVAPFVGRDGVSHLLVLARSVRSEDMDDVDLKAIRAPTLVIWGESDPWVDPRLPDRLVNSLKAARLVRIPGVGRLVPEEIPDTLTELVLEAVMERV